MSTRKVVFAVLTAVFWQLPFLRHQFLRLSTWGYLEPGEELLFVVGDLIGATVVVLGYRFWIENGFWSQDFSLTLLVHLVCGFIFYVLHIRKHLVPVKPAI